MGENKTELAAWWMAKVLGAPRHPHSRPHRHPARALPMNQNARKINRHNLEPSTANRVNEIIRMALINEDFLFSLLFSRYSFRPLHRVRTSDGTKRWQTHCTVLLVLIFAISLWTAHQIEMSLFHIIHIGPHVFVFMLLQASIQLWINFSAICVLGHSPFTSSLSPIPSPIPSESEWLHTVWCVPWPANRQIFILLLHSDATFHGAHRTPMRSMAMGPEQNWIGCGVCVGEKSYKCHKLPHSCIVRYIIFLVFPAFMP